MLRFVLFALGLMFLCLALLGAGYLLMPQERHNIMDQGTLQPPTATSTPTRKPILTPSPTATTSPTPSCRAPTGWVIYTVQPGDNLFRLSLKTNTSIEQIQFANCLTGSEIIFAGSHLYLPFLPSVDTSIPPTPLTSHTLTPTIHPVNVPIRITIPAGSNTAAISGTVAAQGNIRYELNATQGQTLSVKVTGQGNEIALTIYAANGNVLKPLDSTLTWSGVISSNGDYYIDIVNISVNSNIPYTLEMSLITSASTPTATDTVPPGKPTFTPAATATPILTYFFEAEWPARMEIGISDKVRVSLVKASNGYLPTVEISGHTAVASPIIIETPNQELPPGAEYRAYATASLVGVNFSKDPASFSSQPLDQSRIDWIWSISSDKPGLQRLSVSVQIEWRRTDNPVDIVNGPVWRPPDIEIDVVQPLLARGQISVLSLISGFIGSGLSFPWLYGFFRPAKKANQRKVKDKKRR